MKTFVTTSNTILLLFILIIFVAASGTVKKGYFLTAPSVFDANSEETICIIFQGIHSNGLVGVHLENENSLIYGTATWVSVNGTNKCFKFKVPAITESSAILKLSGSFLREPFNFNGQKVIRIKQSSCITLIQTDKPMYKPGQKTLFRILSLTSSFLPCFSSIQSVWIENPASVRIAQWISPSSVNGITDLSFQLSEEPQLGVWNIIAENDQKNRIQKTFKVEEYVLPKFSVQITAPSAILRDFEEFTWKVCAYYTYGEPVIGKLKAITYIHESFRPSINITEEFEFHECKTITVNKRQVTVFNHRIFQKFTFYAQVTEQGTEVVMSAKKETPVKSKTTTLSFISKPYFKPGLPYNGHIMAKTYDGAPAVNERFDVEVTARDGTYNQLFTLTHALATNGEGIAHFPIKNTTGNIQTFTVKVGNTNHIIGLYTTIKSWISPSNSYIQIGKPLQPHQCNQIIGVHVHITLNQTSGSNTDLVVFYQLISRGNVLSQHNLTYDTSNGLASFATPIIVEPTMSPKLQIIMYYIRDDGEIVGDSETFDVHNCLTNKVNMEFKEQKVPPGTSVPVHISTDENSICAVSVTDKSVNLMSNSEFDAHQVFDMIDSQLPEVIDRTDCSSFSRYEFGITNDNLLGSQKAFDNMGMITMTDLTLNRSPCKYYAKASASHWRPYDRYHRFGFNGPPGLPGLPGPRGLPGLANTYDMDMPQANVFDYPSLIRPATLAGIGSRVDRVQSVLPVVEIRNHFPETWIWELFSIGSGGNISFKREIPHTITDWTGSTFCVSPTTGLGVSPKTSIKAFQSFFLTYTLPYSAKTGEILPLIVSIFSYLNGCFPIAIVLEKNKAFETDSNSTEFKFCICGHKSYSHKYFIEPLEIGNINVTVRAFSIKSADSFTCQGKEIVENVVAFDAIVKPLLVKPHGFPIENTKSYWVCFKDFSYEKKNFEFNLRFPRNTIPGSARASISVTGDLMGPTVSGLDNLVRLPKGCGEQNMVLFVPNIFVLQYLNATKQLTKDIESKAISHLKEGYQRELNYKRHDGSYSAFGKSDNEGSMWLTAFVVKSFAQAQSLIYVDPKELNVSIAYITRHQLKSGCFASTGRVFQKSMQGGIVDGSTSLEALSIYVTIALLESGFSSSDKVIEQAFNCFKNDSNMDRYQLAMKSYAAILANQTSLAEKLVKSLEKRANTTSNKVFWSNNHLQSRANDVETTAYVLLTLVKLNTSKSKVLALKVVRWLAAQRNANGGFVSTQDTVLALQAMENYVVSLLAQGSTDITIKLEANDMNEELFITDVNKLLMQTKPITDLPNMLDVDVSGQGCALIQVTLKYNTPAFQSSPAFYLDINVTPFSLNALSHKSQMIEICTNYQGLDEGSNMAVVEIQMVTGFEADSSYLETMKKSPDIQLKRWEINTDGTVELYFDSLTKELKCFDILVLEKIEVQNRKPATIKVYDYYQPEETVSKEYSLIDKSETQVTDGDVKLEGPKFRSVMRSCPICKLILHEDLKSDLCSADTVVTAVVRNTARNVLKLNHDMLKNTTLGNSIAFQISPVCKCSILQNANTIVIAKRHGKDDPKTWQTIEVDQKFIIIALHGSNSEFFQQMVTGTCDP